MALIEINKNPSRKDLMFFGAVFPVFFGVIASVVYFALEAQVLATWIAGVAGTVTAVFFIIPPLRVPLYLGWIYLAFPIGWTVSHLLMLMVYFVVLTPIGLVMRLLGRDPMKRALDRTSVSYFEAHETAATERYFRQF